MNLDVNLLVQMFRDHTAKAHFDRLIEEVSSEKYDFLNYFKRNMVGFVSDGAIVMTGKHGGLVTLLRRNLRRPILGVHCMAHRLLLVIIHSFENHAFFEEFEKVINLVYLFYNSHGSKRKAYLKKMACDKNAKYYELTYIFEIR